MKIGDQASEIRNESAVPQIVDEVLRSAGEPLNLQTRTLMESRFGHDFSRVRIHADAQAAESARAVNAQAYTVKSDVVFDAGRYAPNTTEGEELLTHELVHTIQQGEASIGSPMQISKPNDPAEREAEYASRAELAGRAFATSKDLQPNVARQQGGRSGTTDECAAWFADPQSISKRAAETYAQTELTGNPGAVNSIKCGAPIGPDGVYSCDVYLSDKTYLNVYVRRDKIVVGQERFAPPLPPTPYAKHPVCWYDYQCPPSGELVLIKRQCELTNLSPQDADAAKYPGQYGQKP